MADVAKWLRQRIVIPLYTGSNPVIRLYIYILFNKNEEELKLKFMSRYKGPKLRITRRLGDLPGLTQKQSKKKKNPGQHITYVKKKKTEYCLRLEEKQKLKFNYGLTEKQLHSYVKKAKRQNGITGIILLQLLEMRLDSLCFALGFSRTIGGARQIILHRHITVNKKIINIPSFQCNINDVIGIKKKQSSINLIENNLKNFVCSDRPNHISFDKLKNEGTVMNVCNRNNILLKLNELLVIEYYSRR